MTLHQNFSLPSEILDLRSLKQDISQVLLLESATLVRNLSWMDGGQEKIPRSTIRAGLNSAARGEPVP